MPRRARLAFAASLALIFTLAPVCIADDASNPPAWSPDPALLKQLAPDVTELSYTLRPPSGYELQQTTKGSSHEYDWVGQPHPSGPAPVFLMNVVTAGPEAGPAPDPNDRSLLAHILQNYLKSLQEAHEDWYSAPPQYGTIAGKLFVRAYWKGEHSNDQGVPFENHGFDYISIDGRNLINIRALDVAPYNEQDLKVAEASALTFRSTGGKP